MGRRALAGDGEIGGRLLQCGALVDTEPLAGDNTQHAAQFRAGTKRHEHEALRQRGGEAQLVADRLHRLPVIMDRLGGVTDQIAHRGARHRATFDIACGGDRPFVGVVRRLIQDNSRGPRRSGDHAQRLGQSRRRFIGGRVQRGEELREVRLQFLTPRQRLGHVIHAARDHAELRGLILRKRFDELAFRHALERGGDAGKRRGEAPAIVPEAESEDDEHRCEQNARGEGGLHGVVTRIGGQLRRRRGFGGDAA